MLPDNLGLSSSEQIFEGCKIEFLSNSSSKAHTSRDHFFHEWWCSMSRICLLTEVKQQWAMLVLGWVTTSVHYSSL